MAVIHDLYPNSHIHTLNPIDLHHREIKFTRGPLAIDELSQRIQWIPCWIPNPTIWLQNLHLQVIAPHFQQIVHHQILLMIWILKKTVDRLRLPHHHQAIIAIFAPIAPRDFLDRPVYGYIPTLILEKNRLCARKMVVAVDLACKVTCGVIYESISLVDKSRKQTTTHHLSQWVKAIEPALSFFRNSLSCTLSFHCPLYILSRCNFFFSLYTFFSPFIIPINGRWNSPSLGGCENAIVPHFVKIDFFRFWDIFIFSFLQPSPSTFRCFPRNKQPWYLV